MHAFDRINILIQEYSFFFKKNTGVLLCWKLMTDERAWDQEIETGKLCRRPDAQSLDPATS